MAKHDVEVRQLRAHVDGPYLNVFCGEMPYYGVGVWTHEGIASKTPTVLMKNGGTIALLQFGNTGLRDEWMRDNDSWEPVIWFSGEPTEGTD